MKDYKEEEERILSVIPSPEYNRIVKQKVVDGYVTVNNFTYKVTNTKNTKYTVRMVLFPDGTAKVLENDKKDKA
jgi:hypothetical protein